MKKTALFILPAFALITLGAGIFTTQSVLAQTDTPQNTLVQKIASKFNLKTEDVQAVFDEERAAHHQKMQQRIEDRLNTLVSEGKLTDAQKTAWLAKMSEHKAAMEDQENLTPEERRTAHEKHREEMEAWAKEQGIDVSLFMPMGMGKGRGGMMR